MKFGKEARTSLARGVIQLADAVGCTLGPATKSVIINRQGNLPPLVVNDGVTVARNVKIEDPYEYAGAKLLIEVAQRAQEQAGDGTSTATVLASAFIKHGFVEAAKGQRPRAEIRRELEDAAEKVIECIKGFTVPITKDEEIMWVSTISANGDEDMARLITDAFTQVGVEGIVTVEPSTDGEDTIEIVEGYECEKGYISPIFTKILGPKTVMENALVLVSNASIQSFDELMPAIEYSREEKQPLIVVCREISGAALQSVAVNVSSGNFQMCVVQAEDISFWQDERLIDLSFVIGAKFINESLGMRIKNADASFMGVVEKAVITAEKTTFIGYNSVGLEKRIEAIREDKAEAENAHLEEGVVPGCGALFTNMAASKDLPNWVRVALMAPICKIMTNYNELSFEDNMALVKEAEVYAPVFSEGKVCGWSESPNIIDPSKVVISSLRSAVSVAGYVLTAECVIGE